MTIYTGTFEDPFSGKIYKTVKIGDQEWMAENLETDRYRNGDPIPNVQDIGAWGDSVQGAWCHYKNDIKYGEVYGKLYNWFAVNDPRGLAPEGWHIPTDSDWKELELFLGMSKTVVDKTGWRGKMGGGKLKESGVNHWKESNDAATNISGFTALPGGYRDVDGSFYVLGSSGYWWSSSQYIAHFAWYRSIYYNQNRIHRTNSYVGDGFSVRCLKDQ